MTRTVLDASAALAFIKGEEGAETVLAYLDDAVISAVNLQEVIKELTLDGLEDKAIGSILNDLRLDVLAHDEDAAYLAARLVTATRRHGRGLGDRTCMALGIALQAPVLTADRDWAHIEVDGLDLRFIR